jgi:flotillin
VVFFMLFWHVPAPNEALLISGSKRGKEQAQFRIVTGHGCFVLPVKQKARKLSLALRETEIEEECITNQGIRLNVRAVAAFKVGDDEVSIANAARRFLSEQNRMEILVGRIFAGHLRSIVGGLTVEQIIKERDRVAQEVKNGSHTEMEKLGIVVDALEIQEIDDAIGYRPGHQASRIRGGERGGQGTRRAGRATRAGTSISGGHRVADPAGGAAS